MYLAEVFVVGRHIDRRKEIGLELASAEIHRAILENENIDASSFASSIRLICAYRQDITSVNVARNWRYFGVGLRALVLNAVAIGVRVRRGVEGTARRPANVEHLRQRPIREIT